MNIQRQERDILLNEGMLRSSESFRKQSCQESFLKGIKPMIFILLKNFRDNLGEIFLPLNF